MICENCLFVHRPLCDAREELVRAFSLSPRAEVTGICPRCHAHWIKPARSIDYDLRSFPRKES